ncbi:hypothetical protein A2V54_00480 [candidate division WWE3 bacterium RBG_19FT_COMBO_53_11]|uniref:Calcineurin-like phosphoesterase domain-containing protein n=1 Tax=candidate division WWE3 bacterium RBG_19FT_COMBO_53_11 TaxID=1802613 RepID=A0A1F4UI31_UNCKA|nr:MAG: hypothetical protein A2155_02175 [candidate division WWE3 bacterium RBG_16_52_45]OGC44628.1 MAG: hypothetical protein A2V54_00480 [candidate division WWE3 bacterium RBG_19FT_COMBO_53_11]
MKEIIVISDAHLSSSWDEIEKALPRDYEFLNPNYWFKKTVETVKNNQILVLNGDTVDYFLADYDGEGNASNWGIFNRTIKTCKGVVFLTLGNHDYHARPYNYSIYGLNHVHIPYKIRRQHKPKIGHHKFRFLKEWESMKVDFNWFNPLQNYKFEHFYTAKNGKELLVFLDSGPEALSIFKNWLNPGNWIPMIAGTAGRGLGPDQINFLQKTLETAPEREIIIFVHCPPLFLRGPFAEIPLSGSFLANLMRQAIIESKFVQNNMCFLESLVTSDKNILLVSGHTHTPANFLIDKEARSIRKTDIEQINDARYDKRYVKFISALPLGACDNPNRENGFLKIGERIEHKVLKRFP